MGERTIKMPDVGEGVAEAEIVEWHVAVGDPVREDTILAAVMTDKATVEIPSPVEGEVAWIGAEVGEVVAVGAPIVRISTADGGEEAAAEPTAEEADDAGEDEAPEEDVEDEVAEEPAKPQPQPPQEKPSLVPRRMPSGPPRAASERPLASPAVRLRAKEAGVDLRQVAGSGPAGRIGHDDLDAFLASGRQPAGRAGLMRRSDVTEVKIVGLRRRIAEKMALAKSRIPHITYVEEVDVTAMEELRTAMNAARKADQPKLTILPFLMRAMVRAIDEQPEVNAVFDDEAGVVHRHGAVHLGIATQTDNGLMVPVVRHAEDRDIWDCGAEVARLAEAARAGTAAREELSGSTITITSLGAMGGVVTTPVINHPEVAIVGVNKIMTRPIWDGARFVPRKMMNLSSSFDHRVIDGWDAARFVQRIRALMETPALIFVEG